MPLSKEEYTEFRGLWEDVKNTLTDQDKEIKKLGGIGGESETKYVAMTKRLDTLESEHNKPRAHITTTDEENHEHKQRMQTFTNALRYGVARLGPEERKSLKMASPTDAPAIPSSFFETKGLTVTEDTTGGFFAPPEFVPEIIKNWIPYSPMRQYCRTRPTSQRSVQIGKRVSTIQAQWVGEKTVRTELTGYNLGRLEIPTNEMYALVLITEQDLEDPVFDLETELRNEFSEQFGVAEGIALLSGDAAIQPQGMLTHPQIVVNHSGVSGAVTADSLIDACYNLPEIYAVNARWYMRRHLFGSIRKLKAAGGTGDYLWQPGLSAENPSMFLDSPVTETPNLPDIGAGASSIMFGDLSKAYMVVTRVGMTFKRLAERWVENSQIGIYARMRIGGQVILPEALQIYQLS